MALSLLTALILQNNEVRCFAMGPFPNGKYGGVAYLIKNNQAFDPVISIEDGIYDTCKAAIDKLENIIEDVRELDLPLQEKKLDSISQENLKDKSNV